MQRHYSYSDRIRYYWTRPEALAAVSALHKALDGKTIPETLLRQYLGELPLATVAGKDMEEVLVAAVDQVLATYHAATGEGRH